MWQADDPRSRATKAEVLRSAAGAKLDGAGEGKRTHVCSLGKSPVRRFGSSFNTAKHDAGIADKDLHFHDLRGTAATKFYIAGLPVRVIAEILAWSEDQVERIIRRYVARAAATKETIRKLNEAQRRR